MCLLLTDVWSHVTSESLTECLIYLLHAGSVLLQMQRNYLLLSGLFASALYLDDPQMLEAASWGFSFFCEVSVAKLRGNSTNSKLLFPTIVLSLASKEIWGKRMEEY